MRIEAYQRERHRDAWEDFVARRARNAHFMHARRYLEYHGERLEDHSLLLFGEKAEPLALLPANVSGGLLVSHGGLSFGGLLVGDKFRMGQWGEAFLAIGEHLRGAGLEALDYRPTPPWYHSQPGEEDVFLIEAAGRRPVLLASAGKLQYVGYADGGAMSAIYAHLFCLEEFRGRWFDFGTSMAGGGLDAGLFAYKESLGGRLAPLRRYRLAADASPMV